MRMYVSIHVYMCVLMCVCQVEKGGQTFLRVLSWGRGGKPESLTLGTG